MSGNPLKKQLQKQHRENKCIECKENDARYWGSNLCEDCFRMYLIADYTEKGEKKRKWKY
jgi:hypothetical protein